MSFQHLPNDGEQLTMLEQSESVELLHELASQSCGSDLRVFFRRKKCGR